MAESTSKSYSTDPALYLYTSLTSGSSQIVTATSRLETILKANRISFKAIDIATDEKARMLWGRRSGKDEAGRLRKIPGLVQMGLVIGDLVEIEEWNEYGELKEHVKIYHEGGVPAKTPPSLLRSAKPTVSADKKPTPLAAAAAPEAAKEPAQISSEPAPQSTTQANPLTLALRQAGEEAAQKAKEAKNKVVETFTGVGEAEPEKTKAAIETETAPAPIPASSSKPASSDHSILNASTILQSPTSTAWKNATKPTASSPPAAEEQAKPSPDADSSATVKPAEEEVESSPQTDQAVPPASTEDKQSEPEKEEKAKDEIEE